MIVLYARSRRRPPAVLDIPDGLLYVVLIPCLNEELVIGKSLERLAAIPNSNVIAFVIDDGSDDATSEIARQHAGERVRLLRRGPTASPRISTSGCGCGRTGSPTPSARRATSTSRP